MSVEKPSSTSVEAHFRMRVSRRVRTHTQAFSRGCVPSARTHARTRTQAHARTHARTHTHTHILVLRTLWICRILRQSHTDAHTRAQTDTHTHTHTHTHARPAAFHAHTRTRTYTRTGLFKGLRALRTIINGLMRSFPIIVQAL
jgi:hypothetical protein